MPLRTFLRTTVTNSVKLELPHHPQRHPLRRHTHQRSESNSLTSSDQVLF